MASRVVDIKSLKHFQEVLNSSFQTQLTVVDFFATWCGPCRVIAPKYVELSHKYFHVNFLKVNVDECQDISIQYGVEAMPTFVFIKNKNTVDVIKGADPVRLEAIIQKWMGPFELAVDPQKVLVGRNFPCFSNLLANTDCEFEKVSTVLVKIANNILKDRHDLKYRQIKLANDVFVNKLLPALGAVDCLFAMGFQEMDDRLLLPPAVSLDNLHALRDALIDEQTKRKQVCTSSSNEDAAPQSCTVGERAVLSPEFSLKFKPVMNTAAHHRWFSSLQSMIRQVLLYENKELQKLALSKIPINKLVELAERNSKETVDEEGKITVSKEDCLLLLLLKWFKNDFFTWMNSPKCTLCDIDTVTNGSVAADEVEKKWGAAVVESYQCRQCRAMYRFPRYNHPQKLLETRSGRCGEWANCFTLCCRAVGLEARYVLDWSDHVWTEVYSEHQQRWLHCDACEDICDKPLVYEIGWGKKLTYIIAFSNQQVVDVSWRYTNKYADIISRRKEVSENWLFNVCYEITKELQQNLPEDRMKVLLERNIVEQVEFISPKKNLSTAEQKGRLSGSLGWRQLRGETSLTRTQESGYVFTPTQENIEKKRLRIRYNIVKDCYYTSLDDTADEGRLVINGWQNAVQSFKNIFRKAEHDWKMIYLARVDGSDVGIISWAVDLSNCNVSVDNVTVRFHSTTYENGVVTARLSSLETSIDIHEENEGSAVCFNQHDFKGAKTLNLTAELSRGVGDVAWQHAQLFRCSESNDELTSLELDIVLKDDS